MTAKGERGGEISFAFSSPIDSSFPGPACQARGASKKIATHFASGTDGSEDAGFGLGFRLGLWVVALATT